MCVFVFVCVSVCLCDAIPCSHACSDAEHRYENFELYHLMRGAEIQRNNVEFETTLGRICDYQSGKSIEDTIFILVKSKISQSVKQTSFSSSKSWCTSVGQSRADRFLFSSTCLQPKKTVRLMVISLCERQIRRN